MANTLWDILQSLIQPDQGTPEPSDFAYLANPLLALQDRDYNSRARSASNQSLMLGAGATGGLSYPDFTKALARWLRETMPSQNLGDPRNIEGGLNALLGGSRRGSLDPFNSYELKPNPQNLWGGGWQN